MVIKLFSRLNFNCTWAQRRFIVLFAQTFSTRLIQSLLRPLHVSSHPLAQHFCEVEDVGELTVTAQRPNPARRCHLVSASCHRLLLSISSNNYCISRTIFRIACKKICIAKWLLLLGLNQVVPSTMNLIIKIFVKLRQQNQINTLIVML